MRWRRASQVVAASLIVVGLLHYVVGVDVVYLARSLTAMTTRWWMVLLVALIAYRLGQARPPRSRIRVVPKSRASSTTRE